MIKKVISYFTNQISLWYDKFKDRDRVVMEKNKKGIMDAKILACYIIDYYKKQFKKDEISPLKLQKSLYFCFAYWGAFARKNNIYKDRDKEVNIDFSEYLFDNKIEAWLYGPVVPDVYNSNHSGELSKRFDNNIFNGMEYIQKYINNILDDILPLNDFRLVEISHQDKCWKKNFDKKNIFHNIEIPKEEIIKEYVNREDI